MYSYKYVYIYIIFNILDVSDSDDSIPMTSDYEYELWKLNFVLDRELWSETCRRRRDRRPCLMADTFCFCDMCTTVGVMEFLPEKISTPNGFHTLIISEYVALSPIPPISPIIAKKKKVKKVKLSEYNE